MMEKNALRWGFRFAAFLCLLGQLAAQSTSGSITGRVVDPAGAIVVGARVTLINERMAESRKLVTNETGDFTIPALLPGSYTVLIEQQGFQTFERTRIMLSPNERLSLGSVALTVGAVTEKVTVEAQGAIVQIASAENSALLTASQISHIQVRGRDVVSLLRLLPGVSYTVAADGRDSDAVGEQFGSDFPAEIQGQPATFNTLNVDGVAGNDLGNPQTGASSFNLDSISEVKVLLNGYSAEYGRNPGAFVNIVTKSGTQDFHGGGYWYKRHEMFNANNYFNNQNKVAKPIYRYTTLGATLGGPIYIPNKFNSEKSKLFFFYSIENWMERAPQSLKYTTMPTELERQGDFSQTYDLNRVLVPILDPTTGVGNARQPYPGNKLPASLISKNGRILLNVLPLPNMTDWNISKGNYNYVFSTSFNTPKRNHVFKIDYQPTDNDHIWFRGAHWRADNEGYGTGAGCNGSFPLCSSHYLYRDKGVVLNYARVFSPRVVNEFYVGIRQGTEDGPFSSQAEIDKLSRTKWGYTAGQFYPENNPLDLLPMAQYGGVPSAPNFSWDGRLPMKGMDIVANFNDALTFIYGPHAFKAGFYGDRARENEGASSSFSGVLNFSRDINNSGDTNWPWSNALTGAFYSYLESNKRPMSDAHTFTFQWYAQDTWKVTRKLTLDYGLRFNYTTPWAPRQGWGASFSFERYDPAKAPLLYFPTKNANGQRVGMDPRTGALVPSVMIGAYVPGTGDITNGMVLGTDKTYPTGWQDNLGIIVEPRFGFAYDPFGTGKTAIRGSIGTFHQTRISGGVMVGQMRSNPPTVLTPTIYYGNLDNFLAASGTLFPSSYVLGVEKAYHAPGVYNFQLGVQREVGFATIVDVSYVGSLSRHLMMERNPEKVPYGSQNLPQNNDPTTNRPLPDNFFRPYPGYSSLRYIDFSGSGNYNALQVTANRRFAQGLQMGVAYTWSKSMDFGNNWPTYVNPRVWNYGVTNNDQTHKLMINYTWELPHLSKMLANPVIHHVFDNWQLGGVTAFVSGMPTSVGWSQVVANNLPGGGDGYRVSMTGKAILPHGERTFTRFFDTSAFAPTFVAPGNSNRNPVRNPGVNNWDMELLKNVPLKSESRFLTIRWETYNVFNHTQGLTMDTTARFDANNKQVNTRFGQIITARPPRVMQLSLRLTF